MNLTQLAKELQTPLSYLSEVETGKKKPTLEMIQRYADLFKIKPSAILFFSEELDQPGLKSKTKAFARKRMVRLLQIIESGGKPSNELQA